MTPDAGETETDVRSLPDGETETDARLLPDGGTRGGTYTLLAELPAAETVAVGALGERTFDRGWYAYVGSALGSSGFGRVERHGEVAAGDHDVRHWHVDYFLGDTAARLVAVARTPGRDLECAVAAALDADPVAAFGASDCDCSGHLFGFPSRERAVGAVERAHRRAAEQDRR
jgi:Uri superfamily endonuclease